MRRDRNSDLLENFYWHYWGWVYLTIHPLWYQIEIPPPSTVLWPGWLTSSQFSTSPHTFISMFTGIKLWQWLQQSFKLPESWQQKIEMWDHSDPSFNVNPSKTLTSQLILDKYRLGMRRLIDSWYFNLFHHFLTLTKFFRIQFDNLTIWNWRKELTTDYILIDVVNLFFS